MTLEEIELYAKETREMVESARNIADGNTVKINENGSKISKNTFLVNKWTGKRIVSKYNFFDRFTNEEFGLFLTSMESDINIKVLYEKIKISNEVNLDEDSVIDGINYLVLIGIITEERKQEILFGGE